MLEDEREDIINKALRGQQLRWDDLGLPTGTNIQQLNPTQLRHVAEQLQLNPDALEQLNSPFTPVTLPSEVTMITSQFGHLGVNAFSVQYDDHRFLIDTGTEPDKVIPLKPDCILITHRHPDHIACLSSFNVPSICPENNSMNLPEEVITFDVSGHCNPSLAYFFPHLSRPCCFVGDAVFRRSIGGCNNPTNYSKAISNIHALLNKLPKETILCVGHGPNTTVAEEMRENPFLTF